VQQALSYVRVPFNTEQRARSHPAGPDKMRGVHLDPLFGGVQAGAPQQAGTGILTRRIGVAVGDAQGNPGELCGPEQVAAEMKHVAVDRIVRTVPLEQRAQIRRA
jgi:hypothetical protein